jgi:hypothetical protein
LPPWANTAVSISSVAGIIFLIAMGMYWLRPVHLSVCCHRPPGIVHIAYSILTVVGVISGIVFLIRSAFLPKSLRDLIKDALTDNALPKRLPLVLIATIFMLCFIMGNLLRSYYNLHSVEHHYPRPLLTQLIRSMKGSRRWIEWTLRLIMLVTILVINKFVLALQLDGEHRNLGITTLDFGEAFRLLWTAAAIYYTSLLFWDSIIGLQNNDWKDVQGRAKIQEILDKEAKPVHRVGFAVTIAMVVAFYLPDYFDYFAIPAGIVALFGIGLLSRSWYRNILVEPWR